MTVTLNMSTTNKTREYWLNTFRGWLETRNLPGPQHDEAVQAIADLAFQSTAIERVMNDYTSAVQRITELSRAEDDHSQHVDQHADPAPVVFVKMERNSRGTNFEASVTLAGDPQAAIDLLKRVTDSLARTYRGSNPGGPE